MGLLSTIGAASGRAFGLTRVGVLKDLYFNLVTLLLPGNGTNGAQNNTFLDSSSNNFTITRNGNATQGTFSPFSQTGWSNYFDGTDDYLAVADNAVLRPGTSNFTLEAWIWRNASGAAHTIYAKGGASTGIVFQVTSTNVLRFTHTTTNIDSTGTIAANTWTHVAVVREGTSTNQTKLYINGTQDGQGTVSTDFTQTEEVRIGTNRSAGDDYNGYISNLRFVKGTALYTGNFTPSTTPLTTTSQGATASEVELLTCQSNRFIDNSDNAFAITLTGTPSVQAFSPFAPTAAYSADIVGGSGYFDGTGDYLSAAYNSAFAFPGDFTIEFWVNWSAHGSSGGFVTNMQSSGASPAGWQIVFNGTNDTVNFEVTGSYPFITSSSTLPKNAWAHVAVVRSGSSTNNVKMYFNGAQVAQGTNTSTLDSTNASLYMGCERTTGALITGYLSSARIVKGQALATGAFTPPTAPVTTSAVGWTGANAASSITGTVSLLTNFTNAGITDATAKNDLETVGNAQISTTQSKFGGSSISFNGTNSSLSLRNSQLMNLGASDFTIEFWLYLNATGTIQNPLYSTSNGAKADVLAFDITAGGSLAIYATGTGSVWGIMNNAIIGTVSATTWYHVALVRSGSTWSGYLNGTRGSGFPVTNSGALGSFDGFNIGQNGASSGYLNGYIDDLRISRYARYSGSSFTVPSAAFPTQ